MSIKALRVKLINLQKCVIAPNIAYSQTPACVLVRASRAVKQHDQVQLGKERAF